MQRKKLYNIFLLLILSISVLGCGKTELADSNKALNTSQKNEDVSTPTAESTISQSTTPETTENSNQAAGKAKGVIPEQLGKEFLLGLFENRDSKWMQNSKVGWNARYLYLTKGWLNNWGWGKNDGSYALEYMKECEKLGTLPVIQFYIMNNLSGGGEESFYNKTKNPDVMKEYFNEYKMLMKRVKDFKKPVLVLIEADGFAFLQQQTNNNPDVYSAIKDTGMEELSDLPNTAAGWGMSFLKLKKAVGADNAVLGIHVSGWASGKDIAYYSVNIPLEPEVDKVYKFLAPLGLAKNKTGLTYDVLYGDPLDRDSDYYKKVQNQDRWWNSDDNALINSKSFNRYAEWLRLWNTKSSKRWILWQIPLGNANHLNTDNKDNPREGYKDNRVEYFLGEKSKQHLLKWCDNGLIGLLFGRGSGEQANYTNDYYTDGNLFMKTRGKIFFDNGGITLK